MSHRDSIRQRRRFFVVVDKPRHMQGEGVLLVVWRRPGDSRIIWFPIGRRRVRMKRANRIDGDTVGKLWEQRIVDRCVAKVNQRRVGVRRWWSDRRGREGVGIGAGVEPNPAADFVAVRRCAEGERLRPETRRMGFRVGIRRYRRGGNRDRPRRGGRSRKGNEDGRACGTWHGRNHSGGL